MSVGRSNPPDTSIGIDGVHFYHMLYVSINLCPIHGSSLLLGRSGQDLVFKDGTSGILKCCKVKSRNFDISSHDSSSFSFPQQSSIWLISVQSNSSPDFVLMWSQVCRPKLMAFWMDFLSFLQTFLPWALHLTKPFKRVTLWKHSDAFGYNLNILVLVLNSKERSLRLKKKNPPPTYFSCVDLLELDLLSPLYCCSEEDTFVFIPFLVKAPKRCSEFLFVRPLRQIAS